MGEPQVDTRGLIYDRGMGRAVMKRTVLRVLLESKVWIPKREPEGSCDRGADKVTVEQRVDGCPAYYLSTMICKNHCNSNRAGC